MLPDQPEPALFDVKCAWCGQTCSKSTIKGTSGICVPCLEEQLALAHRILDGESSAEASRPTSFPQN